MKDNVRNVLIDEKTLSAKVLQLGKQISQDYKNKNLLMISVLKGSLVFMADLMRAIDIPLEIDFMYVSSYGDKTETTGTVKIIKDLDIDVGDKDVLVVEDILDSGITLSHIMELLKSRNPKSLKLAALLNKPERRKTPLSLDYEGFVIPDEFVVGYGLDYAEKYRNLPYIGILKREVYSD